MEIEAKVVMECRLDQSVSLELKMAIKKAFLAKLLKRHLSGC